MPDAIDDPAREAFVAALKERWPSWVRFLSDGDYQLISPRVGPGATEVQIVFTMRGPELVGVRCFPTFYDEPRARWPERIEFDLGEVFVDLCEAAGFDVEVDGVLWNHIRLDDDFRLLPERFVVPVAE